jgi:hypothetical protein
MEVARIGQGSSRRESRGWADPPSTPTPPAVRPRWKRKLDQDRRYRACIRSTYHPCPLVGPSRPGRCWPCRHYRRGGEQQQVPAAVVRFPRRPSRVYPYPSGDEPGGGGPASSQSSSSPLRRNTSKTEVESRHDSEMRRVWHSRRRSSLGASLPRTYPGREQQFRARFAVSSSRRRRHSSSPSPRAVRAHCCLFSILADGGYGLSSRGLILVVGPQPMGRAEWPRRCVLFLGDSPTHASVPCRQS